MAQLNSSVLTLQKPHLNEIFRHLNGNLPHEACGLIAGDNHRSQRIFPISNLLNNPTRFEMHPQEQVSAMLKIHDSGWQILAIYHSHPTGPLSPSAVDLAQNTHPDTIHLILSCQSGDWAYRAYMYHNTRSQVIQTIVD